MSKKYKFDDEQKFQDVVEETPAPVTIKEVKVRSRIQSRLQYTGKASGRLYEWGGAGQVVSVLEEDVPELLAKRLGRKGCCGNSENKIFELVQEA